MKSLNKTLILNTIRTDGPISRAEIARKSGLTPPTITNIVGELMADGLVVESDRGKSEGGRKPILLTLNAAAYHIIGVDVGTKQIKVIATDLEAHIIARVETALPSPLDEDRFLSQLIAAVRMLLNRETVNEERIMGIGVGMHGLVNPHTGEALFAPNLSLHNMPLRQALEDEFGVPVEVDNDVRAMALGEGWFGAGIGFDNFIVLNIGYGVGAGIILDRKLYHGSSFTAGEVGHTTVDTDGPPCSCGNHGCLQTLVSGPAIARRADKRLQEKGVSAEQIRLADADMNGVSHSGVLERNMEHRLTGEDVFKAALSGKAWAKDVLRETGVYLGIGVANIINTFNPARVIIGGGVAGAAEFLMEPLRETVVKRALDTPAQATSIVTAALGGNATAVGAVTLVLHRLFIPQYR